jgi:signal transduction histidine kinase/CheY-like chemotaxis protein
VTVPEQTLERVLVLVRGTRDAEVTCRLLQRDGLSAHACSNGDDLCAEIEKGGAAALLGEDTLTKALFEKLHATLEHQPVWSDFPIIVFSSIIEPRTRLPAELIHQLGNVMFLDRPVQVRSMLAAVHAGIRSRRRQYETRRAIESRDQFLAMLGHELRNPLGAICFASGLLALKETPEDLKKEHDIIARQAQHLTRIVDDLLDVARITHGKVVLKRDRLDLIDPIRSVYELIEPQARDHLARFDIVIREEAIFVDGDRQRLEQVFTNLLTNALKYTPRGGGVTVDVGIDGNTAVVAITDTGVGLAPGMHERVFDAFTQADRTLDRSQGGIGLGLSLVRSIVGLHGGTVRAESKGLGQGSSFIVSLPRLAAALDDRAATDTTAELATSRTSRKRVVVVEDNADIRELLVEMLEADGHEVQCAANGAEGLQAILTAAPDVAFIDIGLPEMDGLEVARRLRAANSKSHLVAMTGYGQIEDKALASAAGFNAHLTKPVDIDDISSTMSQVTRSAELG